MSGPFKSIVTFLALRRLYIGEVNSCSKGKHTVNSAIYHLRKPSVLQALQICMNNDNGVPVNATGTDLPSPDCIPSAVAIAQKLWLAKASNKHDTEYIVHCACTSYP